MSGYYEKIDGPYKVYDEAVIWFEIGEEEIVRQFGRWHSETDQPFTDPGPCKYWAFMLPCSTPIVFRCHTSPHGLEILSNNFDEKHLLDHLPSNWIPAWKNQKCDEISRSFQVVRMDDNGNKTVLHSHLSEIHASCITVQMEDKGHKRTYCVEKELS